ncbi:MAG: hypothetical protein ACI4UJ_12920 [Candidatus Cryptobacteroides sp.]
MRRLTILSVIAAVISGCCHSGEFGIDGNVETVFVPDSVSVLRNPCCGWGLYDDADDEVADAEEYWTRQDEAAKYASFFYVRWRWSDMEPEEGRYAWIYDDNYKALVKGALDRGLRLAFRIYINGMDNIRPGTPQYVREAGARGRIVGGHWTPYLDDRIFQQKLEKFVEAFAREYDNPDLVDFVDAANVGWWGECHHLTLEDENNRDSVFLWLTDTYGNAFSRVPLVMPVCSEFGIDAEMKYAVVRNGYGFRRDGLGSRWFTPREKEVISSLFPGTLLLGEQCYWKGDESDSLSFKDDVYEFKTWRQVLQAAYDDAVTYHFNTLDLREPVESARWLAKAPDLVRGFIANGGYRLYPSVVSAPEVVRRGKPVAIAHRWENMASGYFPNSDKRWNYKYKVAFALVDRAGETKSIFIDHQSDPSTFIKGQSVDYLLYADAGNVEPGEYNWAVAIVDVTSGNRPGIRLATGGPAIGGWTLLNKVRVK